MIGAGSECGGHEPAPTEPAQPVAGLFWKLLPVPRVPSGKTRTQLVALERRRVSSGVPDGLARATQEPAHHVHAMN